LQVSQVCCIQGLAKRSDFWPFGLFHPFLAIQMTKKNITKRKFTFLFVLTLYNYSFHICHTHF
uniref:Uncharacterized protein n=1 Tax=Oryzias sinensis TaxID=183150 RepID=A0A8C7X5Q7_9TELE